MPRRPPLTPEILSAEGSRIYPLLNEGSDVSVIVVAVSYIDQCLGSLLAKSLRQSSTSSELLDASSGPIGSFSVRSKLAYALTLIEKPMFKDLGILAELRNEVAHSHFELTFSAEKVGQYCSQLSFLTTMIDANSGKPIFEESQLIRPRNRFILSALVISQRLLLNALAAKHASSAP